MNYKNLWTSALVSVFVLSVFIFPASASERLCDASFENCRTPLIKLIQNENVEIDLAYWFMDDPDIEGPLIKKIHSTAAGHSCADLRVDRVHRV